MVKRTKEINIIFRLTKENAKQFKAQCALKESTMQSILEQMVKNFLESAKEKAE